jgi:LPXTG-motif cell wall-anchored protein
MDQQTMLIIGGVVAVLVLGLAAWVILRRRRRDQLRTRYGPEYERIARERGGSAQAEAELASREKRVAQLQIRRLGGDETERFTAAWRAVQAQFVDDPRGAVTEADRLVNEIMTARGYPVGDFEQRAADISVEHPRVVSNYRSAQAIAERHARGEASTEDLRQALVYYRELMEDLLDVSTPPRTTERRSA